MQNLNQQWRNILEDLMQPDPIPLIIEPLTDLQITQYIEAVLAGEDVEHSLPGIHAYLETNPAEMERLSHLLSFFEADTQLEEVTPLSSPAFQLHFLPSTKELNSAVPVGEQLKTRTEKDTVALSSTSTLSIPEWIEMQFRNGRQWIADQMGVVWIDFSGQILGKSALQPVLVTRSAQRQNPPDKASIIRQFSIGSEELDDLDLEIRALRTDDPNHCTLVVDAQVPSRWPDLGGVEVVVLRSEPVRRGITNDQGQVIFEEFPIEDLERIAFKINNLSDPQST